MDNNLFDKISNWIHDSEYTKKCDMNYEFAEKKYIFKPLKNINKKDESEKRKGFLVYSNETWKYEELKEIYTNSFFNKIKEKNKYRYFYYEKINDSNGEHAVIIMLNPAFADSEKPDSTIKNVKNFLTHATTKDNKNFSSFSIVNLYPIRLPKSDKLSEFKSNFETITSNYNQQLSGYLSSKNYVIAAWGSKKDDNDFASKLFNKDSLYCYEKTVDGYPRHFSPLSYNRCEKIKKSDFTLKPYIINNNKKVN